MLPDTGTSSAPGRAVRKFTGLWLQHNIAAQLYHQEQVPEGLGDAERVAFRLARLKPKFISQTELPHAPAGAPAPLAGFGWCDSITGFAATVLANEFSQVEIVGLYDEQVRGGHSFGRLWSDELGDWLYFDLWPDEVVVFRSRPGQPAQFLARMHPVGNRDLPNANPEAVRRMYDRAHQGLVHNRLQSTLGAYIFTRLWNAATHGNTAPAGAAEVISTIPQPPRPAEFSTGERNRTAAPRAYVDARMEHLMGDPQAARALYTQVLADDGDTLSTFRQAARIFIDRIDAAGR
jgi:hypothetical protein